MKTQWARIWAVAMMLSCGCDAQRTPTAGVDRNHQVVAGPTIAIPSQFSSLPLVEPHISAHPIDSLHLLAAAMVVTDIQVPYESCRLVSYVSSDGGATWTETVHDWWGYDPWTAIAHDGTAVMSWIGTAGSFQDKYPIQLFTSRDGGVTWSKDVQTLPGMHDGTKIVERDGQFFFTTVRFRESDGADVVLFSATDGTEFVERGVIDGKGARLNFCEPAIRVDGRVVVPAAAEQAAWVQIFDPTEGLLSSAKTVVKRPGNWRGYARMVSDPNASSPYKNHVYFVRAKGSSGIVLNRSVDGGETWAGDLRVDHLNDKSAINTLVPSAAVNGHGVLGISWVNQDGSRMRSEVCFTASFDGGVSFVGLVKLSPGSNPRTGRNGDVANKFPGGGHYLGLAARADGSFQAVWSDSKNGLFQLQTCTIRLVK